MWTAHFKAVTWKNYLLKTRRWGRTVLEFAVPIVILAIILIINSTLERKDYPDVDYSIPEYENAAFAGYKTDGSAHMMKLGSFGRTYDGSHMSVLPESIRHLKRKVAFVSDGGDAAELQDWMKQLFSLLSDDTEDLFLPYIIPSKKSLEDTILSKDYPSIVYPELHAALIVESLPTASSPLRVAVRMNDTAFLDEKSDMPGLRDPGVQLTLNGFDTINPYAWLDGTRATFNREDIPQGGFLDFQQLLMTFHLVKQGVIPDPLVAMAAAPPSADWKAFRDAMFNHAYTKPALSAIKDSNGQVVVNNRIKTLQAIADLPAAYKTYLPTEFAAAVSAVDIQAILDADETAEARLAYAVQDILAAPVKDLVPVRFKETPFPTRGYTDDPFLSTVLTLIGFLFIFAMIAPVVCMVEILMDEKANRLTEGAKVMGLQESAYVASWYFSHTVQFIALSILLAAMLTNIMPDTGFDVLFVLVFLFCECFISFSLLIKSIFNNPKIAVTVANLIPQIMQVPFTVAGGDNNSSKGTKFILGLLFPTAFSEGLFIAGNFQRANNPASSLSHAGRELYNFSIGNCILMLVIDIFLYYFLAWYLAQVVQSEYGVAKPWYFLVTSSYWKSVTASWSSDKSSLESADMQDKLRIMQNESAAIDPTVFAPTAKFEASPTDSNGKPLLPVMELRGLNRTFYDKTKKESFTAVNNIWMRLYEGQILALLGHNGAGKTTTISMLTGMLPLSKGDAMMYGLSLQANEMDQARKLIGYCPQHDILFPHMTVREHLEYFAAIKGVKPEDKEKDINEQLRLVGLLERDWQQAMALSGGQKRRLSVAIALLGGSKIVFLDEPSTGVDPYMRHQLWDALKEARKDRVIILTTHFMDEADYLGDRVAIMANGNLQCVGSSLFLKSVYGAGHTLSINALAPTSIPAIKQRVLQIVPTANVISSVAAEIQFRVPFDAEGLSSLLEELDADSLKTKAGQTAGAMGVRSFVLGVTTLEEVFLKAGAHGANGDVTAIEDENNNAELKGAKKNPVAAATIGQKSASIDDELAANPFRDDVDKIELTPADKLFFPHVRALLIKRLHVAKRDKRGWICGILLPVVFVAVAMGLGSANLLKTSPFELRPAEDLLWNVPARIAYAADPAVTTKCNLNAPALSSNAYLTPNKYSSFEDVLGKSILDKSTAEPTGATVVPTTQSLSAYLVGQEKSAALAESEEQRFIALTVKDCALPATPTFPLIEVELMYNATARDAIPIGVLETFNSVVRGIKGLPAADSDILEIGMEGLPISGALSTVVDVTAATLVACGFALIPAYWAMVVVRERQSKAKLIQMVSGASITAYWTATFVWDLVCYLIPLVLTLFLFVGFDVSTLYEGGNWFWSLLLMLMYALSVGPVSYCLSFAFESANSANSIIMLAYVLLGGSLVNLSFMMGVIEGTKDVHDNFLIYIFYLIPPFALGRGLMDLILIDAAIFGGGFGVKRNPWDMDVLGTPLLIMFLEFLVFSAVLIGIDIVSSSPSLLTKFFPSVLKKEKQIEHLVAAPSDEELDDDVAAERRRLMQGDTGDMVQVLGLKKVFATEPPRPAVRSVYFGIPEGQCFGYLGVNGAGKTTTLRMLTGDDVPTGGTALLGGKDILSQQMEVRQLLGYCPQFDALIGEMSARETLFMYARIKGYPEDKIAPAVEMLIEKLSLQEYADRPCGSYSGGNKRKLSVGMALIGNPKIVFLDEPTSGVDPASRRFMWNLISTTMQGRSVILTTHSMEECEALCQNIAIMVAGQLECIGSASHLKSRFGSQYQVELSVQTPDMLPENVKYTPAEDLVDAVLFRISNTFFGTTVAERQGRRAVLKISKQSGVRAHQIFGCLESVKDVFHVRDFAVSETSLEQIFIRFAALDADIRLEQEREKERLAFEADLQRHKTPATGADGVSPTKKRRSSKVTPDPSEVGSPVAVERGGPAPVTGKNGKPLTIAQRLRAEALEQQKSLQMAKVATASTQQTAPSAPIPARGLAPEPVSTLPAITPSPLSSPVAAALDPFDGADTEPEHNSLPPPPLASRSPGATYGRD